MEAEESFVSDRVFMKKSDLLLFLNSELEAFKIDSPYRNETVKFALTVVEHSSEEDVRRFSDREFVL